MDLIRSINSGFPHFTLFQPKCLESTAMRYSFNCNSLPARARQLGQSNRAHTTTSHADLPNAEASLPLSLLRCRIGPIPSVRAARAVYALQISHKYSFHAERCGPWFFYSLRGYYDLLARRGEGDGEREKDWKRNSRLSLSLARLTKTKPNHQFGGASERACGESRMAL